MRQRDAKRLVIDTDVVSAASSAGSERAGACKNFLDTMHATFHRVVLTEKLFNEWKEHQSRYSSQWLKNMYAKRQVDHDITLPPPEELEQRVCPAIPSLAAQDAARKDLHLIQAALATDQRVVSLDQSARSAFAAAGKAIAEIGATIWVNPERESETPIQWLRSGAPNEAARQLASFR